MKSESNQETVQEQPATFKPNQQVTDSEDFIYSPRANMQQQQPIVPNILPPKSQYLQYPTYQQPHYQTLAQSPYYSYETNPRYENQFPYSFQTSNMQLSPEVYIHYEPVQTKYIEYQTIKKKIQVPFNEEIIEYIPVTTEVTIPKQPNPPIYSQNIQNFPQAQKQIPRMYRQQRNRSFQGRKPYENIF